MNKMIIFFLLSIMITIPSVSAQNLAYRTDTDMELSAATDYYRSSGSIGTSLSYHLNKASQEESFTLGLWVLSDDLEFFIDLGSKALIRTTKGHIIELQQITSSLRKGSKYLGYYGNQAHTRHYIYPDYLISREELEMLMEEGILKIRLETTVGMKDYLYKTEVLGKTLQAEYNLIFNVSDFDTDF